MATNATWTVVFEDKMIIKQKGDAAGSAYVIEDDAFWSDSKWSNVWAIQYVADNEDHNDTVEHRDTTPHSTWKNANLGSFRDQFISRWDAAHLVKLQADWDNNKLYTEKDPSKPSEPVTEIPETEAEKIARLGARPTSYSS
tara:strand:+ start:41 stop:463 length:423 start_codon:yes stop_codon:yes gene_type:complete